MRLSIITINYNNAEGLCKTMESVFAQTYRDFEYIVVDGASTDGSVDVIREYAERPISDNRSPLTFIWSSEPDHGIYEAMNRGVRKANGEYTLMLNSGDYLVDEQVIERIIPELHTEDMIQGNTIMDFSDYTIRFRGYGKSDISFLDALDGNFPHQATFIRKKIMEQYGYYDESYKKAADTYFFMTALGLGNATYRYVDIDIANYDVNGISCMKDPRWRQIDKEEDARWYGEHISSRLMELCNEARKNERLYKRLHQYKWIWGITKILARVSEWISPLPPKVKKERVK